MAKKDELESVSSLDKTSKKTAGKSKEKKTVKKKKRITKKPKGIIHKNIGIPVKNPKKSCDDGNCPFHGSLSIRGQILEGKVVKTKMIKSAVVVRERLHYLPKYERYERRRSTHSVHNPPCLGVKPGDMVKFAECRPISKTKSFVIIERRESK